MKFVETRSLKFVAEACGAELRRGAAEVLVKNVCTDSRKAQPGDLFFAIKGEHFDGHDYLTEVAGKGVAAVVVARASNPFNGKLRAGCPCHCRVAPCWWWTMRAPRSENWRRRIGTDFSLPVVCVGGSNGKTTVKELIASVLKQKLATLWSEASFNNDIGVPLTLLRLEKSHQAAVLEAGTNHPGELAPLVKMIQPKFGVITNIGREHLEFFGDVDGVAREEGWLAELLPADGKLFLNGDNEWTEKIAARTRAQVVRVGLGEKNDWRAEKIRLDKNGVTFRVIAPQENCSGTGFQPVRTGKMPVPPSEFTGEYRINLLGRHQVTNALLAIAVGEELGLGRAEIQRGLAECRRRKCGCNFGKRAACACWMTVTTPTRTRRWPRWKRCALCRCKAGAWRCSAT